MAAPGHAVLPAALTRPAQDPDRTSEVEVQFSADGPGSTRLRLEHRQLEHHGPGWEGVRQGVDGEGGWPLYLERYVALLS